MVCASHDRDRQIDGPKSRHIATAVKLTVIVSREAVYLGKVKLTASASSATTLCMFHAETNVPFLV